MRRNDLLEIRIKNYVEENPGLMRRQIARGLQQAGLQLGQQHLATRTGELVALGELREDVTSDGKRLIYPLQAQKVEKPAEDKFIVVQNVEWNKAVEMALQCRKTRPNEPIELIPQNDRWCVVRCVAKHG